MVELKSDVIENLEEVQLCLGHPKQVVKIKIGMDPQIRFALVNFLKEH